MDGQLQSNGTLYVGVNDTTQGNLSIFGGNDLQEGGQINLYNAKDEDTTYNYWFIDADGGGGFRIGRAGNVDVSINTSGTFTVSGALAKGSGSFKIPHPLESKKETHHLVHSFIEGPQADLIYRGRVDLVDGAASVNIDTASDMTEGTFVVLCRDIQSFTTNESGWTAVRSSVSGNTLTIEAQDNTCTDSISWMVVGERQDDHMMDTDWTDENGKAIVEPLIPETPDPPAVIDLP